MGAEPDKSWGRLLGAALCTACTFSLALAPSCVNGTSYDGSYEGGFSTGPDGSLAFSVSPSSTDPWVFRSPDSQFGVYFAHGSFDAAATIAISASGSITTEGGQTTNGYAVTITGAQPTKPWIVFFANSGGGADIVRAGVPLRVIGSGGPVLFGVTTKDGVFSVSPVGNGMGASTPQPPACLTACGLGAGNGSASSCNVSTNNSSGNGSTLTAFDCVIACGDPVALAAQCNTTGVTGGSVQCGSMNCNGPNVCCYAPNATGPNQTTCAGSCTAGQESYACDGPEDCPGASCCASTNGTACGNCDDATKVCNSSSGGMAPCGGSGTCQQAFACTASSPLQTGRLETCAQPASCPIMSTARAIPCGPSVMCTGTEVCCLPKSGGGSGRCVPSSGSCMLATELSIECEGATDCTQSACCAYANGSQCNGACPSDHVVCNKVGLGDCPMGSTCRTPASCATVTALSLRLCGNPTPCPVMP